MSREQLQRYCRDQAFYAFGTTKLFERRMRRLKTKRMLLTYLGIAVPAAVGSTALAFGKDWVTYLAIVASVLLIAQLLTSLWSLVAGWDDKYAYALSATQSNTRLFNSWDATARNPPGNFEDCVKSLNDENGRQESADLAQGIAEKERRYAMRATLFQFKNSCVTCGQIPLSMKPSKCDTCGNF